MALMAWDHVSGFWNVGYRGSEGLGGTFPLFPDFTQFMLRFVTHICAPTFMFLAGTALALSTIKRLSRGESQREVTLRKAKRGVVLTSSPSSSRGTRSVTAPSTGASSRASVPASSS